MPTTIGASEFTWLNAISFVTPPLVVAPEPSPHAASSVPAPAAITPNAADRCSTARRVCRVENGPASSESSPGSALLPCSLLIVRPSVPGSIRPLDEGDDLRGESLLLFDERKVTALLEDDEL